MQRINTANKAANLFGAGKDGFQDGNPTLGTLATFLNALWFNQQQEETLSVIEKAGFTPSAVVNNQLLMAMQVLRYNAQVFNASGSFTVPDWVSRVFVPLWGGGGAGGSSGAAGGVGGGGGAGGFSVGIFTVTPGAVITVTVGAGGTAVAGGAGNAGGTSSFGAFSSATGGGGGAYGDAAAAVSVGGAGAGGLMTVTGGGGGVNNAGSSPKAFGGAPAFMPISTMHTTGGAGQSPGCGGTGSAGGSNVAGGAGAAGRVIVMY